MALKGTVKPVLRVVALLLSCEQPCRRMVAMHFMELEVEDGRESSHQ